MVRLNGAICQRFNPLRQLITSPVNEIMHNSLCFDGRATRQNNIKHNFMLNGPQQNSQFAEIEWFHL